MDKDTGLESPALAVGSSQDNIITAARFAADHPESLLQRLLDENVRLVGAILHYAAILTHVAEHLDETGRGEDAAIIRLRMGNVQDLLSQQ
jgi:hypothetical protein